MNDTPSLTTTSQESPPRLARTAWLAGMAIQGLVGLSASIPGAAVIYEDLQVQNEMFDGLGAFVGSAMIACGLFVAIWSYLSVKMSSTSTEVAAVMGALIPAGAWIGFGWLLNFDDHPSKVIATGIALGAWLVLSFAFARK